MEREAILDLAQEHLMLNNRNCWVGGDDEVVDFATALLSKLDAPAPPERESSEMVISNITPEGADYKRYLAFTSVVDVAKPAPPEVAVGVEAPKLYPYDAIFRAIGDATARQGSAIAVSVAQFVETLASKGYVVAAPVAAGLPAIPEAWKLVPIEPTEAMLRAAVSYREIDADDEITDPWANMVDRIYRAMLAAAPVLPVEQASQPAVRTAGCTLCGVCAATGERITASPIAEPDAATQAVKPLTDEQITEYYDKVVEDFATTGRKGMHRRFARLIESHLKGE